MTEPVTTAAQTPGTRPPGPHPPHRGHDAVVRIRRPGQVLRRAPSSSTTSPSTYRAARIVSVIGQSGGGKTTLLRCVNLLERPDSGTIEVAGEAVHRDGRTVCRDLARLRRTVGMVFQRFHLFPHLTAVENVMLAQVQGGRPRTARRWSGPSCCCAGSASPTAALAHPDQMSGGEQQRVAIARALALQPEAAALRRAHLVPRPGGDP